jgi:hypothetical protein
VAQLGTHYNGDHKGRTTAGVPAVVRLRLSAAVSDPGRTQLLGQDQLPGRQVHVRVDQIHHRFPGLFQGVRLQQACFETGGDSGGEAGEGSAAQPNVVPYLTAEFLVRPTTACLDAAPAADPRGPEVDAVGSQRR